MHKRKTSLFIFLFLLAFLFFRNSYAQVKKVWALGDGEKVFRDDLNHPSKNGNYTWNNDTIRLKGLFNEVLAFQVIVETGSDSAEGIELAVTNPVNKNGKSFGSSSIKYGDEGSIELFTEHYLHVVDSTHPNWFYGSPAAAPKKMKGWIPDALIPTYAIEGRGGFPLNIGPARNQGFWVDVCLPRDRKNYSSGRYVGNVALYQQGKIISTIPLVIDLLPHYLPDENVSNVWVYSSEPESLQPYFPGLPVEQIEKILKFVGHRHRIEMTGGFNPNSERFNREDLNKYKKYLDGTAFTPANGYHGAGEGKGEKIFPIGMYGSKVLGTTKEDVQEQSNLWVDWFKNNAPNATYFWYLIDEPRPDKYSWIKERSEWIKTNQGSGRKMPLFTTTAYQKELENDIDIFAGYDGVDLNALPGIRKKGGDHWFYNGNRPRYGSVILEAAAVDQRINSWIMYKYNTHTWFLWHSTAWDHNSQGPKGGLHQRVYSVPLTFINDDLEFGNGDGILFYPGHNPYYPAEDRGINEIVTSIRLKNIRRGQQDAAIMLLAEKKVGRERVVSLINKVVPRAFTEVSMKEEVPWSQSGDDYDKVRMSLLDLLKSK